MKKGDVRGLSTVIATLLIILLVIIAVAIVWGVVRSIIKSSSESISLGKFTIDLEIVPPIKQTSNGVLIKVKRNPGEGELEGIIFSIFDGKETHLFERRNVDLQPLEIKTFLLPYTGPIVSISIYPIFLTESGKTLTGSVSDIYYVTGAEQQYISTNCTIDCTNKECGDNGCFGSCGGCLSSEQCILGTCITSSEPCEDDCTCSTTTCIGVSCSDGCEGSCPGTLQPDCTDESGNTIWCGPSDNSCGNCGECESGLYCDQGTCCPIGYHSIPGGGCSPDCTVNCTDKECGDNGCGGFCGYCNLLYNLSYSCKDGLCEMCTPNCGTKECGSVPNGCGESCGNCTLLYNSSYNCNALGICQICTPNCGTRECGPVPNTCGESCGNCTLKYGYPEGSCINGICVPPEVSLNTGTVTSVYPEPGHNFITGSNLPGYGEDEEEAKLANAHYIKILGLFESCYQIIPPIDYPKSAGQPTVIQVSVFIVPIGVGDSYEIWETYDGCNG